MKQFKRVYNRSNKTSPDKQIEKKKVVRVDKHQKVEIEDWIKDLDYQENLASTNFYTVDHTRNHSVSNS